MNKLSQVLKKLLFKRKLTVSDLSRLTGIVQPVLYRMYTGETDNPKVGTLLPIANYFNISLDQLIGEAPLHENLTNDTLNQIKTIPCISWESLNTLSDAIRIGNKEIIVNRVSDSAFALLMPDSSMEPLFKSGSLLIFDQVAPHKDRSFVLAKLHETNIFVFRQLLIDINQKYLKPLNPDLSVFQMRPLNKSDRIIACLIESRHTHLPSGNFIEGKANVL